jgi:hypothetical protein
MGAGRASSRSPGGRRSAIGALRSAVERGEGDRGGRARRG